MEKMKCTRLTVLRLPIPHSLTSEVLQQKLRQYGFEECSTLLAFIELFCIPYSDRSGLLYILAKMEECLRNHDNGSDYFIDLRCIAHNTRIFFNSGIQEE
ncbi:hypothetical protein AG28_19880 [Salmonella enterica subsp. enterica]|nr:hypothetical protein [Salmonella enterica]ECG1136135.1 hypothetical protein [Salmonella enterica subsp. enterica]EDV4867893.1 hypothetical protein [Salmonella enterica subsp. enterica]